MLPQAPYQHQPVHADVLPCGRLPEHVSTFQVGKRHARVPVELCAASCRDFGVDVRADAFREARH
jgi:hypothetical protein